MKVICILDINGGWSVWEEKFDEENNCTNSIRRCSSPPQCGLGTECKTEKGEDADFEIKIGDDCPGIIYGCLFIYR